MSDETFLGRWARRKSAHQRGLQPEAGPAAPGVPAAAAGATVADSADRPVPAVETAPSSTPASTGPSPSPAAAGPTGPGRDEAAKSQPGSDTGAVAPGGEPRTAARPEPLPSIESLTPDSDFRPFMQAGVDPQARNAALRKLFSDPHFNVMDGLDVYIDDYGKPDPIPPAMLRALNQARTLRLFDRDDVAQTADAPAGAAGQGRPAPEVGPGAPGADAGGAAVAGPDPVDGPSPATDGAVPGPRTPSAAGALAEGAGDTAAGDVSSDAAAAGPPGPLATDASGTRSS